MFSERPKYSETEKCGICDYLNTNVDDDME